MYFVMLATVLGSTILGLPDGFNLYEKYKVNRNYIKAGIELMLEIMI